jgi:hypothetical protein
MFIVLYCSMLTYPNTLAPNLQFLLPGRGLGERADVSLEALHQRGFVAAVGLTARHATTTAVMAHEPHVVEFCPNDKETRFPAEKVKKWIGKGGGRGFVAIYDVPENKGASLRISDVACLTDEDVAQNAWGWSGFETSPHIPGVNVTTAYRVGAAGRQLAYERRTGPEDKFKLGKPLGELVIATAVDLYGADPSKIWLETWKSNRVAVGLYEAIGFERVNEVEGEERPTLQPLGSEINGHTVRILTNKHGTQYKGVTDTRLFYVLGSSHPLREEQDLLTRI